jgi:hypothetical protein
MPRQLRGAGDLLLGIARFYGTGGAGPALARQGAEVSERYVELASALVGDAPGHDGERQASATGPDRADEGEPAIPSGSARGHPLDSDPARAEVIAALRAAADDERARNEAARLALAHEWMVLLAEIAESSAEPVAEAATASARAWWR